MHSAWVQDWNSKFESRIGVGPALVAINGASVAPLRVHIYERVLKNTEQIEI